MVDLQQKDLRLVLECTDQIKQPLPGVALAHQLLAVLQARGRGRDGTQALIDVIRQLGRKPV
jgi:3-hydroxyisobutyrate dehydrogenase